MNVSVDHALSSDPGFIRHQCVSVESKRAVLSPYPVSNCLRLSLTFLFIPGSNPRADHNYTNDACVRHIRYPLDSVHFELPSTNQNNPNPISNPNNIGNMNEAVGGGDSTSSPVTHSVNN